MGILTFASCFLRAAERLRLGVGLLTAPGLTALRRLATTALRGMVQGYERRMLVLSPAVPTSRPMLLGSFRIARPVLYGGHILESRSKPVVNSVNPSSVHGHFLVIHRHCTAVSASPEL